jgi:putative endonuclease
LNRRGREAEALAEAFLQGRGLRILARNWRCRFGEIDLIAKEGRVLVFAEVRARGSRAYGGAAESIDAAKRSKLIAAANQYLSRAGLDTACRFDALLIEEAGQIEWIRNAFTAD